MASSVYATLVNRDEKLIQRNFETAYHIRNHPEVLEIFFVIFTFALNKVECNSDSSYSLLIPFL